MATSGRRRDDGRSAGRVGSTGRRPARARATRVAVAARPDRVAQAALAVVAGPQRRIAQPVVRDVDPLRHSRPSAPATSGWWRRRRRAPGDLDRLDAGVGRDAEAGIQVVGWAAAGVAWCDHRSGPGDGVPLCSASAAGRGPAREGGRVSFIKRADASRPQQAARPRPGEGQGRRGAWPGSADDPATQERLGKQAREAVGMARRGVTTVVERIDPGTLAELDHQGDGAPGDDQRVAAREGLALPDLRDLDLGVDPARASPSRSAGSTTAERDRDRRRGLVRGARRRDGRDAASAVIALDGTTLDEAQIDAARAALGRDCPTSSTRAPSARAGRAAPRRPRSSASSARRSPAP